MKIAIDIDGTISLKPEFFKRLERIAPDTQHFSLGKGQESFCGKG